MISISRGIAVVSLALLALACGNAGTGGGAAAPEDEKAAETQAPAAAPSAAPGTPEAEVEEKKKVATATLTSLVNAAASPEIKEALGVGLKRLEKLDSKEAVETFTKFYETNAASLETIKAVNSIGEVFAIQPDPAAEKVDLSSGTFALADVVLINADNMIELKKSLTTTLSAVLKMDLKSDSSADNLVALYPIIYGQCYLMGVVTDVPEIKCNAVKKNILLAFLHWNFYRSEVLDYFVADELERDDALNRIKRVNSGYGELIPKQDEAGFNYITAFTELRGKIRNAQKVSGNLATSSGEAVLQLNGKNDVTARSGGYEFTTKVNFGAKYNVTVLTPPAGKSCEVTSGSGRARSAVNVNISCKAPAKAIGGTVSGLPSGGSVVLQLGGANDLTVSNGTFKFMATVEDTYGVTVKTVPMGYNCSVTGGTGTATADVTNVAVTCTPTSKDVSVAVTGMNGGVLKLKLNDATSLNADGDGTFKFSTKVNLGATYAVTVQENPTGKSCNITAGSGTIANDVTIDIACVTLKYTVGGSVSGMASGTLKLRLNGANEKTITGSGAFTFTPELNHGSDYAVTVSAQPVNHTCVVTAGSGTLSGAVTNVAVACTAVEFTLKANVTGLTGGTLTLRNNINLNQRAVTADGLHTFSQKIVANAAYDYDVRVFGQPAGQTCVFPGVAAGTASADVTVSVSCSATPTTYTVGGTVNGLPFGQSVTLRLTHGAASTTEDFQVNGPVMAGSVPFDFLAGLSGGVAYAVTVQTQPAAVVSCSVSSGGSGTIGSANVSDVVVDCN